MCQFLPQDVVKSFPLMSPQDRFLSTVRAVGEGRLVDQFDRLKEIQKTISSNHSLILTKEGTLENLKNKMESVIQKKEHLDEVENKISHKILAEKKLLWARFENDIANAKKIKKKFEDCQGEVKKCEADITAHMEVDKKKDEEEKRLNEQMSVPQARIQETEAMFSAERRLCRPDMPPSLSTITGYWFHLTIILAIPLLLLNASICS